MFLTKYASAIGVALTLTAMAASTQAADTSCQAVKPASKRMACLEAKIDAIKIPAAPSLQGIHIKSANPPRGNQCLGWVDNNSAPHTTECNNDNADFRWNIVPN